LQLALEALNDKKSFVEICAIVSKTAFKNNLPNKKELKFPTQKQQQIQLLSVVSETKSQDPDQQLQTHNDVAVLGKRKEPESIAMTAEGTQKHETPKKCLVAHAATLVREEEDEVACDICPKPKKGIKKSCKPTWHCTICEFDYC